jgi:hypothetical protein
LAAGCAAKSSRCRSHRHAWRLLGLAWLFPICRALSRASQFSEWFKPGFFSEARLFPPEFDEDFLAIHRGPRPLKIFPFRGSLIPMFLIAAVGTACFFPQRICTSSDPLMSLLSRHSGVLQTNDCFLEIFASMNVVPADANVFVGILRRPRSRMENRHLKGMFPVSDKNLRRRGSARLKRWPSSLVGTMTIMAKARIGVFALPETRPEK